MWHGRREQQQKWQQSSFDPSYVTSHKVLFVSMASGSNGKKYTGQDMFKAHEKMIREQGLGLEHFAAVAGHLVAAMKQLSVPQNLTDEAVAIVMTLRPVFDPAQNGTGQTPDSLYTRIGGATAVQGTLDVFYKKVLADPLLSPFFEGVDMEKQRKKQVLFVSMAFGSNGKKYTGQDMFKGHEKMIREQGLGLEHFAAVAGHLVAAMKQLSVPQNLTDEAVAIVMTLRPVFDPAQNGTGQTPDSLYTRIGGATAVQGTLDVFYKKVLADPLLSPFFEGVDMEKQRKKQVLFVSMAFGSNGKKYTGQDMFKAHEKMIREQGLGLEHFAAVAGHLVAAMKQLSVPQNLTDEAVAIVMTLRPVFDPAQNGTGQTPDSLYTRIGGATAVQGTVDVFYKKVLADPLLSPFFEGVDMEKQRKKQVLFVSMAFGSNGKKYTGQDMFKAHEKMIREQGLGLEHFAAVAGHLVAAMKQLSVPQNLTDEAVAIVMTLRPVFDPAQNGTGQTPDSLYTRIGGATAVQGTVDVFYKKVLADPLLSPFFEGVDMEKQRKKQVLFVSMAFGSNGKKYTGQDMFKAHEKMIREQGLGLEHFAAVAGHLVAAMKQLSVPQNLTDEAVAIVMTLRPVFDPAQNGTGQTPDSLYTRIGGATAVQGTVDVFYKKVLADPLLSPFFEGVDMEKQRKKQVLFVSMAFGSNGKKYTGQDMFKAHEKMIREQGLGLEHFAAVAGHLVAAMKQLSVPQNLTDEAVAIVMTLRPVFDPAQNGTGQTPDSLYTRIGGATAVQGTVDVFYKKVLADPLLSPFFEGVDMEKQRKKQVLFVSMAFGSNGKKYTGQDMFKAHEKMIREQGLGLEHFAAVAGHLVAAMKQLSVPQNLTDEAVAIVMTLRPVFDPAQNGTGQTPDSLYTRIGGATAVQGTVDVFYKKVLADPLLSPFFEGVDMEKQRKKQVLFVSMAFGSNGKKYTGQDMFKAHEKMIREQGLGLEHFAAVAGHLVAAMKQLSVPQNLTDEAVAIVMTLRPVFDPAQNGTGQTPDSLYTRIGGATAVQGTVDVFYKKVLADPLLSPFFEGVDMEKQRKKQVLFVSMAFGSNGKKYTGQDMFKAHEKMIREQGLGLEHFAAVAGHLVAAMKQLSVPQNLTDEAVAIVMTLRPVFDPAQNGTGQTPDSLYTRIGGATAVQGTVDVFYKKVLADPLLSPFFEGVDMEKQRKKQVLFVSMAFGSNGKKYTGQDMFKAHEKMIREQGLGLEHFAAVAGHLVAAMKQLSVPQNLTDEAVAIVMTLRPVFDPAQNGTGQTPDSLYTRIGGATAVQGTVDVFYKKVLADPLLSPFFEGVDMEKQRKKQVLFVSMASGNNGKKYTGQDMFKAHEKMIREQGLGLEHFAAVAGHLVAAMKQLSVPQNLTDEAVAIVMTLRPVFDPAQNGTGQTPDSLYTRIGGATAVQGTLDVFYKKVLENPLLSPFFEGVDMEKQRKKQVLFVSMAFGSNGKKYTGQDMFKAHEKMIREQGLGLEHFAAVAGHLVAAMKQLSVPQNLTDEAVAIVMTLRPMFDPAQNGTGQTPDSLYTRIGGATAVQGTLDVFYKKVLADPLLSPFFEGVDMEKQRNKQVLFVSMAFGSNGKKYTGQDMFKAHEKMIREQGIGLEHFDAVAGHLVAAMKQLSVPQNLTDEAVAIVMTLRPVFDPAQNGTG
eukprot:gene4627-biopygen8752